MTAILGGIRAVTRLLVRARTPADLLRGAAEALVESGAVAGAAILRIGGGRLSQCVLAGEQMRLAPLIEGMTRAISACADRGPKEGPDTAPGGRHVCVVCAGLPATDEARDVLALPMLTDDACHGALLVALPRGVEPPLQGVDMLRDLASDIAFTLHGLESDVSLRESERRHRVATESVSDVVWALDLDALRFTYVSPSVERLRGYTVQEVLAQAPADVLTKASRAKILRALPERLAAFERGNLEMFVDELEQPRKDGTTVWVETRSHFDRDEVTGHVIVYGTSRDITDRRRAERALRERLALQEQLASVAESVPGLIYSYEPTPDGRGGMSFTTPAIEDVFGISQASVVNDVKAWAKRIHPEDASRVLRCLKERFAAKAPWHDEYRYLHPVKGLRWIEGWSVPKTMPDGSLAWHGFVMDTTEKKAAEQALRELAAGLEARVLERTGELARAAQAKDDFLASMSHELRTPLNGILGLAEILEEEEDVYGRLNDKQRRAVGRIRESGRHLLSLINDILDVAKVESGKLELERGAVDVGELCRASLRLVQEPAIKKSIRVGLSVKASMPRVIADERRLKQVIVNLLTNAVKFTPAGGQVDIEADVSEGGEAFTISVSDTGIGISKEDAQRLFQPFVQLDSRLSRSHTGTGLGLALVQRLVALHGGEVTLTSEPGSGSRFTVKIPVRPAARARGEAVSSS